MILRWNISHVVALASLVPLAVTACTVRAGFSSGTAPVAANAPPPPAPAPALAPAPVAQAAPPAMQSGVIEAGCSFNGSQLRGEVGGVFQVSCPGSCQDTGGLWGTDIYTADSAICKAGIHAGLVSAGGGMVTVRLEPGRPAYRGSVRNGVRSYDYGNFHGSYSIVYPQGRAPVAAAVAPGAQVIEAGCSFNGSQIRGEVGTVAVVNCPSGCADQGGLWGTDNYTADSAICKAGIHQGLISPNGGTFSVVLEAGRPAYRGSVRNGIRSYDYGNYHGSYRLQR